MQMMIISAVLSALIFPLVGKLCDNYEAKKIVPFSFLFRCFSTVMFCFLETPDSNIAYVVCVLVIIGSIVEQISVDSIFAKNLPKETRGILNGVYSFSGQLGVLVYSLAAGYFFDKVGPKTPFVMIGVLDFFFAILCLTMGLE